MRELEGVNILHKSDNDYNPNVVKAIRTAKRASCTRDYRDVLSGAKSFRDIEERTEYVMPKELERDDEER